MAKETVMETPAEPTMAQVLARLADIQAQQLEVSRASNAVQVQQVKQTTKRHNETGPDASPFNPRGEKDFPMAKLKCTFWYQFQMTPEFPHALTREEVDLLNLIEPCQVTIKMNDEQPQVVCVVGKQNSLTGEWEVLRFKGPKDESGEYTGLFTEERKTRFPSTVSILRQILGDKANGVMTMAEEKRRIKLPPTDPDHLPISRGE